MKRIIFNLYPGDDPRLLLPPQPASQFVPQWYRDGEKFINKEDGSLNIPSPDMRAGGLKTCMPFLDSIISGYIQPLSCAIEITKNDGTGPVEYRYVAQDENGEYVEVQNMGLMDERDGAIGHTMPRPAGYAQNHLVWSGHWGFKLPRGWSALITHPMNQFQLPFITSSGIMESDRFISGGNVPWYIKAGWTGIIPKGTAMFQIIPIKRAKWLGIVPLRTVSQYGQFSGRKAREVPYGFYKNKLWVKKQYDMEK